MLEKKIHDSMTDCVRDSKNETHHGSKWKTE